MEKPTSDEKVLAALAHASVILSFFGPVGSTIIWSIQRNKSKYVRFHALQAMGYQALSFWVWLIGMFVVALGGAFLTFFMDFILTDVNPGEMPFFPFIIQPIMFLGIFGLWGIFFIIGIVGAVFCMLDRDFNYPFIGHWLKRKVFDDQITEAESEEWEDNWVSGVCHSTAIVQLWGIITPFIVWFSQKERSAKLRLQALQALIYQLAAVIAYVIGMAAYMAFFVMLFAGMLTLGSLDPAASSNGEISPALGIFPIIFMGILMIFWLFFIIAVPVYYLLAAIASILTIRGKNFKYPILGGIITKRMNAPKKEEILQHEHTV